MKTEIEILGSKVYVLVMRHKYDTTVSVHATQAGLVETLWQYVSSYWTTGPGGFFYPIPIPEDKQDAIDMYFEDNEIESYEIFDQQKILP